MEEEPEGGLTGFSLGFWGEGGDKKFFVPSLRGGHLEGDSIKRRGTLGGGQHSEGGDTWRGTTFRGGDTWRGTTLRGGYLREQNELTPDSYEKI